MRLDELCIFLSRGKSPKYSDTPNEYPVFAQKCNLKEGGISIKQARFLDSDTIAKWDIVYRLCNNDILINSTGTGTVGRTRLFKSSYLGHYPFTVPDSHVSVVRLIPMISAEYIFSVISSNFYQQYMQDNLAGSTNQKELYIDVIGSMIIPLPPIHEQAKINSRLEIGNILIGKVEIASLSLTDTIHKCKSKILELAMQGKLVPQNPADELAADMLRRVNPKAKIITDNPHSWNIPNGWCVCELRDLCSFLSRGKSPKYSDVPNQYPVFAQKCNLKDGGISLLQARYLDETTVSKWPEKYKLKDKDVLVNSTGTGTVGRTRLFLDEYLMDFPFIVPDSHVSVVRTFDEIDSTYIYFNLISKDGQSYFDDHLSGSTNQKELYIEAIGERLIFLPPQKEQQRIVEKIKELYTCLDEIEASLQS